MIFSSLPTFEELFRSLKQRFRIHLQRLSAPKVLLIAAVSGVSIRDTIARLRDAGLDSISTAQRQRAAAFTTAAAPGPRA